MLRVLVAPLARRRYLALYDMNRQTHERPARFLRSNVERGDGSRLLDPLARTISAALSSNGHGRRHGGAARKPTGVPPWSDAMKHPEAKSVGWALVQAARLHRGRMGDELGELGLFAGQEQVLQALAVAGLMTMGELASVLRVRPPTASKTVSRLAALRLVERHAEPDDARIVRVKLTDGGPAQGRRRSSSSGTRSKPSFSTASTPRSASACASSCARPPRTSPRPPARIRAGLEAARTEDLDDARPSPGLRHPAVAASA